MKLMGIVWNTLPQKERMILLRNCKTFMSDNVMKHESTLDWDKLWPMRQDELCDIPAEEILGRTLAPRS